MNKYKITNIEVICCNDWVASSSFSITNISFSITNIFLLGSYEDKKYVGYSYVENLVHVHFKANLIDKKKRRGVRVVLLANEASKVQWCILEGGGKRKWRSLSQFRINIENCYGCNMSISSFRIKKEQ